MRAVYHSCPAASSHYATAGLSRPPRKPYATPASPQTPFASANAVFECLNGRPKRLATFPPGTANRITPLNRS